MKYSLEYFQGKSLESEDGSVMNEGALDSLLVKLDAEKFVSLVFTHANANILTVSGGNQKYIVMFSDSDRIFELTNLVNKGGESTLLRTGHSIGKFPSEMIVDPFTTLSIIKEFYRTGKKLVDLNWVPLN